MNNIRHPYILAIIGVVLILVVGSITVKEHSPATLIDQTNGRGVPLSTYSYTPTTQTAPTAAQTTQTITQNVQPVVTTAPQTQNPSTFSYNPPASTGTIVDTIVKTETAFDFNSFMKSLLQSSSKTPSGQQPTSVNNANTENTYMGIPLDAISTPSTGASARTNAQQALYQYGNEAGSYIQSYEQFHSNQAAVVQDYFADRGNPTKVAALQKLGADIKDIGISLKKIENVPAPVATAHLTLADSYIDAGTKLAAQTSAQSNSDLLKAINTYNSAAEKYIRSYVTLAETFPTHGVFFAPEDPGSVFSFSNTSF